MHRQKFRLQKSVRFDPGKMKRPPQACPQHWRANQSFEHSVIHQTSKTVSGKFREEQNHPSRHKKPDLLETFHPKDIADTQEVSPEPWPGNLRMIILKV